MFTRRMFFNLNQALNQKAGNKKTRTSFSGVAVNAAILAVELTQQTDDSEKKKNFLKMKIQMK